MDIITTELKEGWQIKETDNPKAPWIPSSVPTNIHLELLKNEIIPDPFLDLNELETKWVARKSWTWRLLFLPGYLSSTSKTSLIFEGLDTYATVKLNDHMILDSDNMFISHQIDVTEIIEAAKENMLEINFESAELVAKRIKSAFPNHAWKSMNAGTDRLCARKAQYHWGWDWGPVLNTCGPWKPVRLETYQARIDDLWTEVEFDTQMSCAKIQVHAQIEGSGFDLVTFALNINGMNHTAVDLAVHEGGELQATFLVASPELWYPHGYGAQPLYELACSVFRGQHRMCRTAKLIALRKVELVQEKDKHGRSFYFRMNNIDIFCGGSNWIPADSFLPRISPERYKEWLQLLVRGNQCMVRVWGGGIWESDVFYNLCDEMGIMVWQDFMFACGIYPTFPKLLRSIEKECECQLKRLRHHPSIVVFAGNNEDYVCQEINGLTYDYEDHDPQSWLDSDFPGRYIYEKLLPEAINKYCPDIPYHPGSPFSGRGISASDLTVGDVHQWNVWHGTQEKYQTFPELSGRFVSEFGMEAFPHIQTIKSFVTNKEELYPQSRILDSHNKATGHERRMAIYVNENFRMRSDLEGYIHLTQLAQSEAMLYAYRGWRQQWGEGRKCGGALCWQLNDCWPAISWAICDYYLRKKPAYYVIARALAPIALGLVREHHDWSIAHAESPKKSKAQLWAVSNATESVRCDIDLRSISIVSGEDIRERRWFSNVVLSPNGTTNIMEDKIDNKVWEPHVLSARLFVDGCLVARAMDWPQPYKYLSFEDRGLRVELVNSTMRIQTDKPVKGLVFEERDGISLSDNAIDVAPHDEQVIHLHGFAEGDRPLTWRYLGSE